MRKHAGIAVMCAAGLLAGCATMRQPVPVPSPPPAAPELPEAPPAGPKPPPAPAPTAKAPPGLPSPAVATTAKPPPGSYLLDIESAPAGALIVVNEQPVGKAPLRLVVKGTPAGFFKEYLTIHARFLADSPQEVSASVMQNFTPLDKIPAKLIFTPQGAQRQLRE